MAVHSPRLAGATLREPVHICAFVDSRDEEFDLLLPFVREGLDAGEKAVHFVDGASHAEHCRRLDASGIDVAARRASGQLDVRSWQETYLRTGTFDVEAMLKLIGDLLRGARAEGFPRARLIGYAGWDVDSPVPLDALVDYEMRVNRILRSHDPVICVYNRAILDSALTAEVLRAHPLTIVDGAIRESPSFRRPSVTLCKSRDATDVMRDRYLAALLAGDRRTALDIVVEEALASEMDVPTLYLRVIQPALYEIGRLWEQGRIGVTQERVATNITRQALAQLSQHLAGQAGNGKLALVACVEGELHDLGAQMVADLLEMAGFDARFLGANVPTASLVEAVRSEAPHLLVLSATLTANLAALREAVAAVRAAVGARVVVTVGGQALAGVLPHELGADAGGTSALDAVAAVRRLRSI